MKRNRQSQLYATFVVIAFFTLDTTGLTRVDHHGYRAVNNTFPNQWNAQQQGASYVPQTTPDPGQRWTNGGQLSTGGGYIASPNAANQWNRFNQTGYGGYNGYQAPSMAGNQWQQQQQRYNNTPTQPGSYNSGLPGWNSQVPQQHYNSANTTAGQSHLYPQLPQSNPSWNGGRQQKTLTPTVPSNWNSNNQWNNTSQQYPGGANKNSWSITPNRTTWGGSVPTTLPGGTNSIYSKAIPQPSGYITQNQTYWDRPNSTSNYGWGGNTPSSASSGQNDWKNWKNNPSNPSSVSDNSWSSGGNSQGSQGINSNSGIPLAPIGGTGYPSQSSSGGNGNSNTNPNWSNSQGINSNSGIPLAPIGGTLPLAPISSGNGGNWNSGSNNSPQLAPLSYGSGNNPYENPSSKKGNTNPYSNMFN